MNLRKNPEHSEMMKFKPHWNGIKESGTSLRMNDLPLGFTLDIH
jgi:hypothetical protein